MQINNKQSPIVSSTSTSTAPAAPQAPVATPKGETPAATGFGAGSTFATASRPAVALSANQVASAAANVGPLALDSQEAKDAIQKSLTHLRSTAPTAGRGLVAGGDVSSKVTPRQVFKDELGMTHVRLDRTHEGTKVFAEQLISHLDKDGKVASTTGTLSNIPKGVGSAPVKLEAKDALAIAQKQFAGTTDRAPTSERVVAQDKDGNYRAAYHVQLTKTSSLGAEERPRRMNYLVDANTGELFKSFDQMGGIEVPHAKASPSTPSAPATPSTPAPGKPAGKADDNSMYSGKVDLSTTKQANGTYTLEDKSRGGGVVTYDAKNKSTASGTTPFTDTNDVWGEAGDNARTKAAVDAHYGAEMTYDFMKDVLGRNSLDGKGEKLVSYVHVNERDGGPMVNAYWDGEKMNYGDGDGKNAGPLTTLDIAGHEIAHGLTERTAGLIYDGESGGLNESFSDIIGSGVEWYAAQKNKAVQFDWKVGEDAWTPANGSGDALRYMDDPTKDGYSIDHYSNYPKQTEVHGSSGIANNAFYLVTEGGKNRTSGLGVDGGIGMDKSQKIFGRALTTYMTPNTTFAQAREATVQAATDLYGAKSVEVQKVKDAWTAVGVK
ncbi:M4 family metallopeptidase [Cystobacter fuscus]|uniref:M4 family metallopeptidase n=1 Tax=Cystobacter fuscus TaxID=43 RepID=UPI002B2BC0EA|nr:M4 family metallopeptidase [Cystobacter fuscus]